MPWKESSVMEEKARFVLEYEQDVYTMTELCHRYGIARETGYVWLRRYQQTGLEGLRERPRAPQQPAHQTPAKIEKAVLELRQAHMRWGPRKLKRVLERDQPEGAWPAPGHPQRQRCAVCFVRAGRVVPAGGVVDEVGDCAGADSSRASGAEWTT